MQILYKALAEILLLHEFYVTDSKFASVFAVADQSARLAWLSDNYDPVEPSISTDLRVCPDERTAATLKNQQMRLVPTNWGFIIAVRVTSTAAGYQPMISVPANLSLVFLLQKNNMNLDGFTDSRLSRALPALYYASNQDSPDPKTFPYLSNAYSAYDASYPYEMGELFTVGGALQQYTADGSATPYTPVADSGFVSENDRLLVPLTFPYAFKPADNVTQATFTLKDASNNIVTTITMGSTAAGAALLGKVGLDFTTAAAGSAPATIGSGGTPPLYTLEVMGNGGYSKEYRILFYPDEKQLRGIWGVIELLPTTKTAAFDLLTSTGTLVPPAPPPAPNHPVFELRIKSRLAYWRYIPNADGITLATNANTTNYLSASGNALVTKTPRIATYTPTLFTTDNINYDNLPNPVYGNVLAQSGNQFFQDIWVSKTELFT
jgi:hypothetical protein